ncbi:MAG: hypothetical protein ACU85E_13775 [Gammaproteobacteria bacterium]
MKNSFYLIIPAQQEIPERIRLFEEKALQQWIDELPIANPGLSTRLLFDLLKEFNSLKMSAQSRLDALELLRPSFLSTEDYLRFRLTKDGFPKTEDEQKIFHVLVEIEKEFTLGYWIAVKEMTRREVGWFQGKHVALSLHRAISGLSHIVVSHFILGVPIPDWVWIDIHSLHRLSVKIKKVSSKVPKSFSEPSKAFSVGDCYRQILLLSLTQPEGLMQKEILQVFNFIESLSSLLIFDDKPVQSQSIQCVILTDEDQAPCFVRNSNVDADSSTIYIDFTKFLKALEQKEKLVGKEQARFNSMAMVKSNKGTLSADLLEYLTLRWNGVELQGVPLFGDRLDRYLCIGLDATYQLLSDENADKEGLEFLVESTSEKSLSCSFNKTGMISIGSLVSFRKKDMAVNKRSLGVINKVITGKSNGKMTFEIQALAGQVFAVTYQSSNTPQDLPQKALIYGVKTQESEKSYIILESFNLKEGDVIRMTLNQESFPIILRDRRNIGLGYWQFECRRIEEQQVPTERKKGYDFI